VLGFSLSALGPIAFVPIVLAVGCFLALTWAFLYLSKTPHWRGKMLCLVGLPWICFSGIGWPMTNGVHPFLLRPLLLGPGLSGATLLMMCVILFIVDHGRPVAHQQT